MNTNDRNSNNSRPKTRLFSSGGKRSAKPASKPKTERSKKEKVLRAVIIAALSLFLLMFVGYGLIEIFAKPPTYLDDDPGTSENDEDVELDENGVPGVNKGNSGMTRREKYFTMLLACKDRVGSNTDSMILVSFDVKNMKVNMMNLPRDTMSNVDRGNRKLNAAYAYGELDGMISEVTKLTGVPIDNYVIFGFDSVEKIIDAIGGVTFDVPVNMNYDDPGQDLHIHISKGVQKLNGADAVRVLRFRKNNDGTGYSGGDIQRIENFQNFIMTLADQVIKPSTIPKVSSLSKILEETTDTDLKLSEIVWLGKTGLGMDLESIATYTLPGEAKYVYEPALKGSRSYWVPDKAALLEIINANFNPYTENIKNIDCISIEDVSRGKNPSGSSSSGSSSSSETDNKPSKPDNTVTPPDPEDTDKPSDGGEGQDGQQGGGTAGGEQTVPGGNEGGGSQGDSSGGGTGDASGDGDGGTAPQDTPSGDEGSEQENPLIPPQDAA